jgi:hypothetical protein
MWKKLLKGVLWLVLLLAAAGYLFVWQGLGVNPLEGDEDHLWDLVSNQAEFFARFPGTDLLGEPVVEGLGEEEALGFLLEAKERLADAARDIAREVNPQIPLGLFQVDLEKDLAGKEMAIAGIVNPSLSVPKLEQFVVLLRIPGYAKFVSALQRDFVRSKVPNADRISVVRGLYFKVKDPKIAEALAGIRAGKQRPEPDALWFARIRDVLVLTDDQMWIEDALRGGADTLPADVDFKTEFIPLSVRRGDIELHMRPRLAAGLFRTDRRGGPLDAISRLIPPQVLGNVIVQATPEREGIGLRFVNHPEREGYARMTKQYAIKLYEREKADLRFDYTENGIGRLLPRRGVVGAVVLHADADTFAALAMDSMSDADRSNLDSLATKGIAGGRAYASYETLLAEIGKDLAETHMLVIHRPAIFDGADLSGADQPMDAANPSPQPSFSFVSAIRDNVAPEKVVEKITQNLRFLGLQKPDDAQLLHKSGKYYVTEPLAPSGDFSLFHPAYAALTEGGRYFVFTSSPENMEAILAAAADPEARLLAEPGVAAAVGRLPAEGTLSVIARGAGIRDYLTDRVRTAFWNENSLDSLQTRWRKEKEGQGVKDEDELDRLVYEELDRYKMTEYPRFRDDYRSRWRTLAALDTAVLGVALGVGPSRMVKGEGYFLIPVRGGAAE